MSDSRKGRPRIYAPICSFDGCLLPHASKGYCAGHYYQQRRKKKLQPLGLPRPRKQTSARLSQKTKLGGPSGSYVVPTIMLADFIEAQKDRLNEEYTSTPQDVPNDSDSFCWDGNPRTAERGGRDKGWIQLLSMRAARMRPITTKESSFPRRIHGIMRHESLGTQITMADKLILACGRIMELDTIIPTLPCGPVAAREMVDVYHDLSGEGVTELERMRLAEELLAFARGFCADPDPALLLTAPIELRRAA